MPKNSTRASAPSIGSDDLFQSEEPHSLAGLNEIIAASKPMVHGGKKAVLGEGPIGAELAFVGEQPGDQEDLQGRPFVGPAGQLLDKALAEAGIHREDTYVTNAVKHFKYEERGKRRIHQKPTMGEIKHYRWWLLKELGFVHPRLVVALGATAAAALAGEPSPSENHGENISSGTFLASSPSTPRRCSACRTTTNAIMPSLSSSEI